MGIRIFSKSSYDTPNPDPHNYELIETMRFGKYLILKIKYPDCTNYEGIKILMYKDVTLEELTDWQSSIDPHFSDNKNYHSPIARFEPTDNGWKMAVHLAIELTKQSF